MFKLPSTSSQGKDKMMLTKSERGEAIRAFKYAISDRHSYDLEISDMKTALTALESYKTVEEIEKIIYDIERKTCASEKCEISCPAYYDNDTYPCGVRLRSKALAQKLSGKG